MPLADGLVIDTPGMRELALQRRRRASRSAFDDVERAAAGCRFSDCRHAVRARLRGPRGPRHGRSRRRDRFRAYRKLEREARRSELANDAVARKAERRKWSSMMKGVERHMQQKYGAER